MNGVPKRNTCSRLIRTRTAFLAQLLDFPKARGVH